MKIAIFIILYIVGIISTGVYLYIKHKTENFGNIVFDLELILIVFMAIFFPFIWLFGLLMKIIEKIGDKLCKDQ